MRIHLPNARVRKTGLRKQTKARISKPRIILPKNLPPELIVRLRKAEKYISARLGKMKNIDHRRKIFGESKNADMPGSRVREMNVRRNFPRIQVVIKRV